MADEYITVNGNQYKLVEEPNDDPKPETKCRKVDEPEWLVGHKLEKDFRTIIKNAEVINFFEDFNPDEFCHWNTCGRWRLGCGRSPDVHDFANDLSIKFFKEFKYDIDWGYISQVKKMDYEFLSEFCDLIHWHEYFSANLHIDYPAAMKVINKKIIKGDLETFVTKNCSRSNLRNIAYAFGQWLDDCIDQGPNY